MLIEKKLEHLLAGLKQRGVTTVEGLGRVEGEEIDGWKDVPVGYRIKLKQVVSFLKQRVTTPDPVAEKEEIKPQ